MKIKFAFLLAAVFFFVAISGCSKKNSNPVSNNNGGGAIGGIGGTGGGSSNVTFQIRSEAGQNGGTEFDFSPSENLTLSEIFVNETTIGFKDTVQITGTTAYQKGTFYPINEYTGVQNGMHFKFEFIGKTSADNKSFDVTAEYTVQSSTNNNPTFQVQLVQDQQQQPYFEFTPDTSVTVNLITADCADANVNNQQIQGDGTTVFSATVPFYIGPVTVALQSGQQWTFTITGKIGSTTGQDYTSTVNFTIP